MATLLLRFAAPLQSWGINSKFDRRDTYNAPTKSGIIGLLGAALGLQRNETKEFKKLTDNLRIGIRVDKEGVLLRDYQTVQSKKHAYVTQRFYLADAIFLVGLQGEFALLQKLKEALESPVFPLFLGRRSCPPEGQIVIALHEQETLDSAFVNTPSLNKDRNAADEVRVILDAESQERDTFWLKDRPVKFDIYQREFALRSVKEFFVNIAEIKEKETEHNPFIELEV